MLNKLKLVAHTSGVFENRVQRLVIWDVSKYDAACLMSFYGGQERLFAFEGINLISRMVDFFVETVAGDG